MNYQSLIDKTITLRGRLNTAIGSKDAGEEVTVNAPAKTIHQGLSDMKEKLNCLLTRKSSSDEIGWVLEGATAPVQDETDLFYKIWDEIRNVSFGTSSEQMSAHSYLLVPGLFCNSYPTYFRDIIAYFKSDMGLECEIAQINTEGAVKSNATVVRDIIIQQYAKFGKNVILLGHSKGGTDAAATCAMYWSELKDKVRGLIMLQAVFGGTPLATDLLGEGQFGTLNSLFLGKLASFANPQGTVDAVRDLTYKSRRAFLEEYPLPSDVPTVCFHSNFPPNSQARFKKYMMKENFLSGRLDVPLEIQLGRQLALMSKYILMRYPGEESDGLVTRKDAEVPGSVVVKFREELAHTLVIPEVFPAVQASDAEIAPAPLNASLICRACVMLLLTTR